MQFGAPLFLLSVDPDTGETHQYGAEKDPCCWAGVLLLGAARCRAEDHLELREVRRKLDEEHKELVAQSSPEERPPVVTRGCKFTLPEGCAFEPVLFEEDVRNDERMIDRFLVHPEAFGEAAGVPGAWGHAIGGMGAITQAMAASGRAHGVEYRTSAPVERIIMEGGRAVGVRIEGGEEFRARHLLANTDPKRTFLKFVGREHLPARSSSLLFPERANTVNDPSATTATPPSPGSRPPRSSPT